MKWYRVTVSDSKNYGKAIELREKLREELKPESDFRFKTDWNLLTVDADHFIGSFNNDRQASSWYRSTVNKIKKTANALGYTNVDVTPYKKNSTYLGWEILFSVAVHIE